MTSDAVRVLGICGSLRKGSFNASVLRAAVELAPPGMTIEIADIRAIPMYDEDVRTQHGFPASVETLRESVRAADALLIVSPEYNYSVPGVLKNAIDWASRAPAQPFDGKPLAIMGATGSVLGTARMQYHLRQIAVYLNMLPLNKPEVFVGGAPQKIDAEGRVTDEATRTIIAQQLVALAAWTRRLKD